jgi:predicted nucleic acid-binding protein
MLDANDDNHNAAKQTWIDLVEQHIDLIITNYIVVETFALVQRRLGVAALRTLQEDVLPILQIHWITEMIHKAGTTALLVAANRRLSLVDCASFETMRTLGIKTVFAFDRHFSKQGFECIPTQ